MRRFAVLFFGALALCLHADDAPVWLHEVAARPVPDFGASVTAVVLLQEKRVTVSEDGRHLITIRKAIKILEPGTGQCHLQPGL